MQIMYACIDGELREFRLPCANTFVLPGIRWGAFDDALTPAFWRGQAWQHSSLGTYSDLRLGRTLAEEVAACLLGGYGMPAELALAAYARIRGAGLLNAEPSAAQIESLLSEPFQIGGRPRHYRFVRQKSYYLSRCLARLPNIFVHLEDAALRDELAKLPGIGLKTASWIVRNHRASNAVAIIDIHILRAGRQIGLFPENWGPERHYRELEKLFLRFAEAIEVPAAMLDGLVWDYMRRIWNASGKRGEHKAHPQLELFNAIQTEARTCCGNHSIDDGLYS